MAWETRTRGGRYYTISKRSGGVVTRHYVGTGPVAELMAARVESVRRENAQEVAAWQATVTELRARESILTEFCRLNDQVAAAVLITSGYHRHHRGEWRRKRYGNRKPSPD